MVTSAGLLEQSELESIDNEVLSLIDKAVMEAKSAPAPDIEDLLTDVYVSY